MQNLRMYKEQINTHQTPTNKISDFEFQKLDFFLDNLQSENSTPAAHHAAWGISVAGLIMVVVVILLIYKCKSPLYKLLCKNRAAATKSIEEPKNEQENIELMNVRPQFAWYCTTFVELLDYVWDFVIDVLDAEKHFCTYIKVCGSSKQFCAYNVSFVLCIHC